MEEPEPEAWEKEEVTARAGEGGGGFPGEEASAVVDCRRCHLIDSVARDSREGSTEHRWLEERAEAAFFRRGTAPRHRVHVRWLRPRSNGPAGRAPRGQVVWRWCRLELPVARSCSGGIDWSSATIDWSSVDRRRRGGAGMEQRASGRASRQSAAVDWISTGRRQRGGARPPAGGREVVAAWRREGTRKGEAGEGNAFAFATPLLDTRFFPLPLLLLCARQTSICLSSFAF
jgi:hypothetical protein